jgi:excinuclease ABC subunit A
MGRYEPDGPGGPRVSPLDSEPMPVRSAPAVTTPTPDIIAETKPDAVAGRPPVPVAGPAIRVRGAKEHNLKNIDVEIPRDRLVVVTGLSGSGKSSLAFDTIFAEGQRKYMESLSAYARQFLDQLKKPDVEEVEGIPPTIAIEQRGSSHNPRSTVATTTEIYDYLRLLFARCGTPRSWAVTKQRKDGEVTARSGALIEASSATQIVDAVMKWLDGASDESGRGPRLMILAPVIRGKKGFHKDTLEEFFQAGWQRARVNGDVVDLRDVLKEGGENPLGLHRYKKHSVDAVVDRVVLKPDARQRLAESVEAALRLADGAVVVARETDGAWMDHAFSEKFADPDHPEIALSELSPRLFSFNSPFGACPTCHGLGSILEFDPELVIPDHERPMLKGGIAPWKKNGPGGMIYPRLLRRLCRAVGLTGNEAFGELDEDTQHMLLHGTGDDAEAWGVRWSGILPMLQSWWEKTESTWVKDHLHLFQSESVCHQCCGDRLRIEALHVLVESSHTAETDRAFGDSVIGRPRRDGTMLNVSELSRLNINDAVAFVEGLKLTTEQQQIAEPIVREVLNRLRFLASVGLEYLSLDRRTATLSGGEAQRIRLATQVGSGLVGACYVLDEPTIGLHQRDNDRLIRTLRHLADIGNTVLVVEHDEDMIRSADHVLDIGPGPGVHGGRVVAQGTVEDICATAGSLTGDYLAGRRKIDVPVRRRTLSAKKAVTIKGARANNLKKIDAAFPLGGTLCVTGVSGSGKSTLVNEILLKGVKQHLRGGSSREKPGEHTRINGLHQIDRIIEVDQSPIGRTPRSNPATYTGIFDDIRKVFTQAKESKIRGYKPGRFSFNVAAKSGGGRCEACQGQGLKRIEMHFLPDVFVECEVCQGKRYNRETLEVTYRGKHIADVLDMTIEEACSFFENHPKILRFAECLRDVGLDYIKLGQPSTTLSGGEAQRVKLATELGKGTRYDGTPSDEHTLYVLDEPTTGLHFEDIRKLVGVLDRLADAGNTLVVIEHNLDVIKTADWLIDLGPEGGDGGGTVVATGTPEAVAKVEGSHTGRYLKDMLA